MELSERNIQKLEDEGYPTVYEWFDEPNMVHHAHSHEFETKIIITEGSMKVMCCSETRSLQVHDVLCIPAGTEHEVLVGPHGCKYVIGEK